MGLRERIDFRRERLNRGLSQQQIADEIGIPRNSWARLEDGKGIHPSNALLVARYFDVEVVEILPEG